MSKKKQQSTPKVSRAQSSGVNPPPKREANKLGSHSQGDARRRGEADADADFPIVGLGASAGGLNAFRQFFSAMPDNTGMAFVLIQHLDPTHESLTAELLDKQTGMSVIQVTNKMRVQPNHVYVIPPNRYLTIASDTLHLTEPVHRRGVRVPIDFFFRSLAEDQHERAIGIVLSGTGSDGTLGAREIKAAGGMVMVQTPDTAQYDGMPQSAINAGVVDYVLPTGEMPQTLIRYVQHWYIKGDAAGEAAAQAASDHMTMIIGILRARLKYDFSCYKRGTLTRRIQRRMGLMHLHDMGQYVEALRQRNDEVNALYKDLLIGVTNFFREPDAWQALRAQVIEPLVAGSAGRALNAGIRVWTPGCATGEEAYSIAMLIDETMREADARCDVNILASDIDADALAVARAGVYPENIAVNVAPERLRRHFSKGEHTFGINKDIREMIVFAEQNVISDPPFSKLDLIICRNLMIYLEPEIQKRILRMFHFALREGGWLFLGNAETVGQQELFRCISRKWRIFRRIDTADHGRIEVPIRAVGSGPRVSPAAMEAPAVHAHQLSMLAQRHLIRRFAPASVVVNYNGEIKYLSGPVDEYLQLPTGEPTLNLIATARPGLRTKLRAALGKAIRDQKPLILADARVTRSNKQFPVRIIVEPLRQSAADDGLLLVAFDQADPEDRIRLVYVDPPRRDQVDKPATSEESELVIRQLEADLTDTREDLQTTVEELDTSNEEFKAVNEEVTSINEELQSTNEELETSKEELQSMNEELQTVNSQLEAKVGELEASNNDLSNLLASIDQATLFLGRDLRIRRFTPAATHLLRVINTDVGRPFRDFAQNVRDEDLLSDAANVLSNLTPIEKEILNSDGRSYVRRIVPYRTDNDRIDGVVLTFYDITDRVATESESRRLATVLRDSNDAVALQKVDGSIIAWNRGAERMYGYTAAEALTMNINDLVPSERRGNTDGLAQRISRGEEVSSFETQRVSRDGQLHDVWLTVTKCVDGSGELAIATTERDITERKRANLALRESEQMFRLLVEGVTDYAIFMLDHNGLIRSWNDGAARIKGYASDEIIGRHFSIFHENDAVERGWPQHQLEVATERGRCEDEGWRVRKDGSRFWASVVITAVRNEAGKLIGFSKIIQDLSEKRRSEQALRDSEERLRLAAEATGFGTYDFHVRERSSIWSRELYALTGILESEVPGEHSLSEITHPDDSAAFQVVQELAMNPVGPGQHEAEYRIVRSDGQTRWVRDTGRTLFEGEGDAREAVRVVGTVQDISERKLAELRLAQLNKSLEAEVAKQVAELKLAAKDQAQLAAIVETSSAAIISARLEGTILQWNAAAERLFGYTAKQAVGQNVNMLIPPDRAGKFEAISQSLLAGDLVQDYETVRLHRDGTRVDVAMTVSLVGGAEPIGLCSVISDIRTRKRLEESLAEAADLERRAMGRDVHDTLAQQITGVAMLAASLRDELADPAASVAELMDKLELNVERMHSQVRTITNGLIPVNVNGGGLSAALDRLAAETNDTFPATCSFQCENDVPCDNDFAASQLFFIAREATHNAAKHAGAREITIRLSHHEGIRLTVTDDGGGLSENVQESAGMGLKIMHHRASLIGASLEFTSPPTGGTIVNCFLPKLDGGLGRCLDQESLGK